MRPRFVGMCGMMLALCGLGCSVNILKTFSNTTSDQALYVDAQKDLDAHDWNGALTKISSMSTDYAATTPVLVLKASAYGGICGFDFLTFAQALQGMASGAQLFPFLLKNFDAASATNIDGCVNAQNTIESIGTIAQRSTDNNLFLAFIAMAKIGNILSYYADPSKAGTGAAGFDPCAVGASRQNTSAPIEITDADARELGTGLSLAAANLGAVAGSVSTGSSQLTAITSVCSMLPAGFDFCAVTDPAAFTANEVKGIRSLVKESTDIGLGTNCTGDVTTCNCP